MRYMMELYGVFVCISLTWALPVQKESSKDTVGIKNNVPVVHDQEKQLEYLASLAGDRPNGLDLEKVQTFKFTNVNGKEKGVKETKSKVNGEMVSDIKEKFKQDALSGKPGNVKTEIDIPAAGVHKVLTSPADELKINSDKEETVGNEDGSDTFDFSPEDVAAYLFQADDKEFLAFDRTLQGLVNSSIMTPLQASEYRDQVREAFNRLVMEAAKAETEQIADYQGLLNPEAEPYPGLYDNQVNDDIYDLLGYQGPQSPLGIESLANNAAMDPNYLAEDSLTSMIKNAMDEWLTNAIVTGDQEAEALLTSILNDVSKDDNPDDLGQMREMLMDFFTNEVLDNMLVPRGESEDLAVYENTNALPKDQIITDSKENSEPSDEESKDVSIGQEKSESNEIQEQKVNEKSKEKLEKEPTEEEKEKLKM